MPALKLPTRHWPQFLKSHQLLGHQGIYFIIERDIETRRHFWCWAIWWVHILMPFWCSVSHFRYIHLSSLSYVNNDARFPPPPPAYRNDIYFPAPRTMFPRASLFVFVPNICILREYTDDHFITTAFESYLWKQHISIDCEVLYKLPAYHAGALNTIIHLKVMNILAICSLRW